MAYKAPRGRRDPDRPGAKLSRIAGGEIFLGLTEAGLCMLAHPPPDDNFANHSLVPAVAYYITMW
jgi:hypothetical protein